MATFSGNAVGRHKESQLGAMTKLPKFTFVVTAYDNEVIIRVDDSNALEFWLEFRVPKSEMIKLLQKPGGNDDKTIEECKA